MVFLCRLDLHEKIYKFPTDPFVASFVGETNFITGNIQEISNGSVKIETSVGILHSECVYHNFTQGTGR